MVFKTGAILTQSGAGGSRKAAKVWFIQRPTYPLIYNQHPSTNSSKRRALPHQMSASESKEMGAFRHGASYYTRTFYEGAEGWTTISG
jgi:hypothetical protein